MTIDPSPAPGGKNLGNLIASMAPILNDAEYIFATIPSGSTVPEVPCVMQFCEAEGRTLIITTKSAKAYGLATSFPCRMITLSVQSSLEAIGFLAAITAHLAAAKISVNAVSAFYHDHLFVPSDRASEAMTILENLARSNI